MAKFLKSAASKNDWINDSIAEVSFIGRSNVGKSTLINAITNSKLARTSNTPGRTQLVNFFEMDSYRLVDLPGYGYAKVSYVKKLALSDMILEYLNERENLKLVFQVCDANILTQLDQEMATFLQAKFKEDHFIILNKIDKQNKSFFYNNRHKFINYLKIPFNQIIPISALKKININGIYQAMKIRL